jgi:prenyltransferase beta subunit
MSALTHAQAGPGGHADDERARRASAGEDAARQRAAGTGEPDLWCTYAAVRTLAWLGRTDEAADAEATARYLRSRRNSDGGYAWSVGMPSDAWATFYCTQALTDLGHELPEPGGTARWLSGTWTPDGTGAAYAMTPGQAPDV